MDILTEIHKKGYNKDSYVHLMISVEYASTYNEEGIPAAFLCKAYLLLGFMAYGDMVLDVFNHWRIREPKDLGRMVYELISMKILMQNETDRPEDFEVRQNWKKVIEELKARNLCLISNLKKIEEETVDEWIVEKNINDLLSG